MSIILILDVSLLNYGGIKMVSISSRNKKHILMVFVLSLLIFLSGCDSGVLSDTEDSIDADQNVTEDDYIIKVAESPEDGFHWPYYIYIPEETVINEPTRLIVESNNPMRSNDMSDHEDRAYETARYNPYSNALNIPIIVPAFPRFEEFPEGYEPGYYIALDEDALASETEVLERLDKQLINMIDHVQDHLAEKSNSELNELDLKERIFITGDSASGSFANRFTKLHPERVRAITTGAQDYIILPFENIGTEEFNYPSGVNDFRDYTGENFDLDAYKEVAKFYTAGILEGTLNEFAGSLKDPEQREAVRNVFGTGLLERWDNVEDEYNNYNIPVQFKIYNATSHEIRHDMIEDRINFFEANLGDELVEEINTHQYAEDDFAIDFERIEEVTIKDVYWGKDPNIPQHYKDFFQYDGGGIGSIVFVTEEGFGYETQLVDFILNAGFPFTLESDQAQDVELDKTDVSQGIYRLIHSVENTDVFKGIYLDFLHDELDHSAMYELILDSPNEAFNMPDEVILKPIE